MRNAYGEGNARMSYVVSFAHIHGQKRASIATATGIQPFTSKDILRKVLNACNTKFATDFSCAALAIQVGVLKVSHSSTYRAMNACFKLTCVKPTRLYAVADMFS